MVIELVEIGIRGPTLLVGLHGGEVGSRFKRGCSADLT
jgi:hypothetical protein